MFEVLDNLFVCVFVPYFWGGFGKIGKKSDILSLHIVLFSFKITLKLM